MRVLIVDDDTSVRLLVRAALEGAGHVVVDEATTGREAIALAAVHEPEAIVLDGMMPEMTGIEALPELRRLLPTAAIVMFSSLARPHDLANVAPATAYVEKGNGFAALVDELALVAAS